MEYEIYNELKYTTLQIRATLVWKGMNKNQKKRHRRKSPQGGWGMGSKEPIQKIVLLTAVIVSNNWYNSSLILICNEIKSLQSAKIKGFSQTGDPWGDLNASEATFEQQLPLFSVRPTKG